MEAASILCPYCQAAIPLADINVVTDIALCRGCGRTAAFSTIGGAGRVSLTCLAEPPRSIRVENGFSDETKITYRRVSPGLFFLIPFAALWSGGSMIGIYGTQIREGKFDLHMSLFGIPFAIGTLVLLSIIVYLAVGKWVVTLNRGEGSVFTGVGPLGWTRLFSYNRNTIVSLCMTEVKINNRPQEGIRVCTDGKDLIFGSMLKKDAKQFIAAAILQEVGKSQQSGRGSL